MNKILADYERNERILLNKLLSNFDTVEDYYFTNGKVCYDGEIIMKDGRKILAEVKVRNFEINTYPDYILQVDKLISLCKKATAKKNDSIYYINFFKTTEAYRQDFIVFNLMPRIKEWKINKPIIVKKWMNAETYKSNYKIEKEVILLEFDKTKDMKGSFNLN